MACVTASGKNVDEAIIVALKQLKASYDEVNVRIIDNGSKGIFGIGAKDAMVEVSLKWDPATKASTFLQELLKAMNIPATITTEIKDGKHMYIDIQAKNMGVLIGKRGQTLDSLQYLVNLVVNKDLNQYISVTLDTENYRKRRKETLESLAFNLAKKVKTSKRKVSLEPMNPYERRIIHAALQNDRYVTTYSEGDEPYRNIVISLK